MGVFQDNKNGLLLMRKRRRGCLFLIALFFCVSNVFQAALMTTANNDNVYDYDAGGVPMTNNTTPLSVGSGLMAIKESEEVNNIVPIGTQQNLRFCRRCWRSFVNGNRSLSCQDHLLLSSSFLPQEYTYNDWPKLCQAMKDVVRGHKDCYTCDPSFQSR